MAIETGRPSQKTQRSRKGKKAWRKNIDLDEFEQNIDEQKDAEITLGPEKDFFTVDKKGSDEGLTSAMKSEKRLKSHEILNTRSAVPALLPLHKKKDKPKHKVMKDRKKLLERAGFTDKSKTMAQIEADGILRTGATGDLWGSQSPVIPFASKNPKVRQPPEAPIPGTSAIDLPSGGQSYNPALEEWKATIQAEHAKLEEEEAKREKAEEEKSRIEAIIAETEARLAEASEESEDDEEEEESVDASAVKPKTQPKRKTTAQRNRQRKHKLWLYELSQLKQKKQFMQKLAEDARKKQIQQQQQQQGTSQKQPKKLLRAHSAHQVAPEPLAVKLSDELEDSLRRLKPEGNLFKERMRSLQARGIIEARVPVKKPKSRSKMVEKWSYKHFQ